MPISVLTTALDCFSHFTPIRILQKAYNVVFIGEPDNNCALKTVGAFNASISRYVPFRPVKICPIRIAATQRGFFNARLDMLSN